MKKKLKAYAHVSSGLYASSGSIQKPNPALDSDGELCFPRLVGRWMLWSAKALFTCDPDHKHGSFAKAYLGSQNVNFCLLSY